MGDNLKIPMVFIKVDPLYDAEAWLALVMGKTLWIECSSPEHVDGNWAQIKRRVDFIANPPPKLQSIPSIRDLKPMKLQLGEDEEEESRIDKLDILTEMVQEQTKLIKILIQDNQHMREELKRIQERLTFAE